MSELVYFLLVYILKESNTRDCYTTAVRGVGPDSCGNTRKFAGDEFCMD